MARTTQLFSVSVATIAAKMSLVIPVIFSLFIFKIESKPFSWINYLGIFMALLAILLSSIKRESIHRHRVFSLFILLMPFMVFLFNGFLDTTMNYANNYLLSKDLQPVFPITIFISAAIIGTVTLILRKKKLKPRYILGGVYLGIPNYFSVFFLLKGLSEFSNDGAIYFPLLNVGIILFSSLAAMIFLKERLQPVNKFGLILSILAIIMLSYQELYSYFEELI
jgi:drug/metabolite transporter (DMT)-like permease